MARSPVVHITHTDSWLRSRIFSRYRHAWRHATSRGTASIFVCSLLLLSCALALLCIRSIVGAGASSPHAHCVRRNLGSQITLKKNALTLTFFCAPRPFEGVVGEAQTRAIMSWLRVQPTPHVVLMGSDPTFDEISRQFPGLVSVEPNIDTNFRGLPLFHSLIARAMTCSSAVSVFLNADLIVMSDFALGLRTVASTHDHWVVTGMRTDVSQFPYKFQLPGTFRRTGLKRVGTGTILSTDTQTTVEEEEVLEFVHAQGTLHTYGGVDFWAWNNVPGLGLHSVPMPPFAFGRGRYDNWFLHEIISSQMRHVVDASDAITTCHEQHAYGHRPEEENPHLTQFLGLSGFSHVADGVQVEKGKNFWTANKAKRWEAYLNVHLSQTIGTGFVNQLGTALHCQWKLTPCYTPQGEDLCLLKRKRPATCACEHSSFVPKAQSDPFVVNGTRIIQCGMVSVDKAYGLAAVADKSSQAGLPHTMEDLLTQVSNEDKVVVMTGCSFAYRNLLINFVCRAKSVGVDHILVAAFDEEMYRYAFTQGLSVFYDPKSSEVEQVITDDCLYGSVCFATLTKLKSKSVLRVLQVGYDVLWVDPDVVLFKDPRTDLRLTPRGSMVVQSNEPSKEKPANGKGRINSGFYFVRSEAEAIRALTAIVEHGATSPLAEQPSFYSVLCGPKGERRVGEDTCEYSTALKVQFLDREKYPNGEYDKLWDSASVVAQCKAQGCIALHNNWIAGLEPKVERLMKHKLWQYDPVGRMCVHGWAANKDGRK